MQIHIEDTFESLSKKASDNLVKSLKEVMNPVVCFASGDSPTGLYNVLVEQSKKKKIDVSGWYFIGLDEWSGMNGNDEGSCRFYLDKQLFKPLKIKADHICFFDGRAKDPQQECLQVENFIREHGGIDCAVVGLGMNGHVGMNEPGTSHYSRSHVAELHPLTQKTGQKYFNEEQDLSTGLTIGLGTLMEARHIILIASGENKAEIVKKVMEEEISEDLPASLLRHHPDFSVFLDAEAAQLLAS
jgi:galactosamine-6-phosphate isomerase